MNSLTKAKINILCTLTGVHHYDDAFEKLIRQNKYFKDIGVFFRRRISPLIQEKRILFIHVPKNAGTSISRAIYGCSLGHKTAYFYRQADATLFAEAVGFAVLRNPVDRFLSAFSFIQNGGGGEVTIEPGFAVILKNLKTIDSILDFLEKNMSDIYQMDHVLRPQSWYLMDNSGHLIVKNLFVLGLHNKELEELLSALNVPEIRVLNKTQREEITLSPSQLERVQKIYRLDMGLIELAKCHGPMLRGSFYVRQMDASYCCSPFSGSWVV